LDQKIIDLYDEYTHAPLERRVFLSRLSGMVGVAMVPAVLAALEPNYAQAAMVAPNDAKLETGKVMVPGPAGSITSYVARPKGNAKLPVVIVIHENRGLNAHIEDVARRVAKAGMIAVAPDLLSRLGGTPADPDAARDLFAKVPAPEAVADLRALVGYARTDSRSSGKVGTVGFCWGGGMVNNLAVAEPTLDAAVVFYGMSPKPEQAAAIRAPLLMHYAGLDQRINDSVPPYEAALKAAGKKYTINMYPNVNHAFHNDTSAERYNAEAAKLAWDRTIAFFKANLGSGKA